MGSNVWRKVQVLRSRATPVSTSKCATCGLPIFLSDVDGAWWHDSLDGGANRGCRAASFTEADGWRNTSLSHGVRARPVRKGVSA